jgi:hypothetical protein
VPRDANGTYTLPETYEAAIGAVTDEDDHNLPLLDIADELTASVPRAGTAAMTQNLPMGDNKITGMANGTSSTHAVTKSQLDSAFPPDTYVGITGNETIAGVKTFDSHPVGPDTDPTSSLEFARKSYVDARVLDTDAAHNTGTEGIAGVKTFSDIPLGPGSNPSTDNQAARKAYADTKVPIPTSSAFPIGFWGRSRILQPRLRVLSRATARRRCWPTCRWGRRKSPGLRTARPRRMRSRKRNSTPLRRVRIL